MGLISWIKNKYYDHKLAQADKFANNDSTRAQEIYESLIGKHPYAEAHLAKMLVDNASSTSEKLNVLIRLKELRQNLQDGFKEDFNAILLSHVSSIENLASTCFARSSYKDAVDLIASIQEFRGNQKYNDTFNKYKAFYNFNIANNEPLRKKDLFKDTLYYLNQLSYSPVSEVKELSQKLEQQKRYARGINFLTNFQNLGDWVINLLFDYVVYVISQNDSELKNVKHYSDFSFDKKLNVKSATDLYNRAKKKFQAKDYTTAVLYDTFASEYLSDNNSFNYDRCLHILEEGRERANASEIKELISLAESLKLNNQQLETIENNINEIAVATSPEKSLAICSLYLGKPKFDKVYLEKALTIAKAGGKIDLDELRKVIRTQSNEISLPDTLAPFVAYIPNLEQEFIKAAINAIIKKNSTPLLDKYWKVTNSPQFIEALINSNVDNWKEFANHIVKNQDKYLEKDSELYKFCDSIREVPDLEFILSSTEVLLKSGKKVQDFYITVILNHSKKYKEVEKSLDLINRGLTYIQDDQLERLLLEKKNLISRLINEGKFDRAETEIKSILNTDSEAPTLLAELYFKKAKSSTDNIEKIGWLYKVLDVNEGYSLYERFHNFLQEALAELSDIAKVEYNTHSREKAYEITNRISQYWQHWIPVYSWLRSQTIDGNLTLNAIIKYDGETLKEIISKCPSCNEFDSDDFNKLWSRYYENILKKSQSQPHDKAITSLSKLLQAIQSFSPVSFKSDKEDELIKLIVKLKWELANEYEHDLSFAEAIKLYDEVAKDKVQSYINRAELRSLICHVKSKDMDNSVEARIQEALRFRSYQALREDLAFRFACYLLEVTRPAEAETLLQEFLPEEHSLLDVCENIFIKEAEQKLFEFNNLVNQINEGKMTVAEATEFKRNLREYKKQITKRLPDLAKSFANFSNKIDSYILSKMFEEEAYKDILEKLMQENPNYIEEDTDFRNIAIASLGLVESQGVDEIDLKKAIATFLSAIFTDRLFVKSLDYTSWDDPYNFTLNDSLGGSQLWNYDNLPDNVNFNDAVENSNIAIKDVQNSLLARLENSVRKLHPELEEFCNEEKDVLTRIVNLGLSEPYIIASPFLAKTLPSIRTSIKKALDNEVEVPFTDREEAICLGYKYGFHENEYGEYAQAINTLVVCKSIFSEHPVTTIDRAFDKYKLGYIKKYDRLWSELISDVRSAMNLDTKALLDYKAFLDKYEPICKSIDDSSLSLTCSNYVNGKVIHLLNEDRMELRIGVGYMVRLYNIAPSNIQVKKNLEGMLSNLVLQVEQDGKTLDKNALNKAIADTGNSFKALVEDATIQAKLSMIVDKVNSDKMKKSTALSEVYNLYKKDQNNERICENLVTLCEMCIFEYVINGAYGSSSVKSTLNSLQNNMSATFKRKASKLATTYRDIFNQLPSDTQMLIERGYSYDFNQSLNSKGEALKEGLNYLKKLGSVSSSRRGSGRLGFLDDLDLPF